MDKNQVLIEEEVWKPLVGYEILYLVSSHGRLKSADSMRRHYKGGVSKIKGKLLATNSPDNQGYIRVKLYSNGQKKSFYAHVLVAEAFIDKIEGKYFINHKDGDKTNNYYKNLERCTSGENKKHAYEHLDHARMQGEVNGMTKLTKEEVIEIRKLRLEDKLPLNCIAKRFFISGQQVSRIANKISWAHL